MDVGALTSIAALLGLTAAAVVMDFRCMKISNRLILLGLAAGFLLRIARGGAEQILPFLGNIFFPVVTLYLFYLTGCIGAGDIKLFSVIGGFTNFTLLWHTMAAAFVAGAVWSLVRLLYLGIFGERMYSGCVYLLSLLMGDYGRYEGRDGAEKDLMHFSAAILFGLAVSLVIMLKG